MLRISEIMELCANFYNVFPTVKEGYLSLEHYDFHDKGGSYTADQISIDATQYIAPNGLPWEFGARVVTYEKQDLPERIETKWGFDSSFLFQGWPIEVLSKFVQKGNVKNNTVSRFYTDIDLFHVAPDTISSGAFMLFECEEQPDGSLKVPVGEIEVAPGEVYRVQNPYGAFAYAAQRYLKHGLPAPNVKINKQVTTATTTKRAKIQNIILPDVGDIVPGKLIKTSYGNARVETMQRKIKSGDYQIKLRHKTQ